MNVRKMRCPFQQHWSPRASARRKCGRHIKLRKKCRRFWLSSLAIATASGKGTAVFWTASRRITRQVAPSALGRHSSQAKCTGNRNRPMKSGRRSFKGRGPKREVQVNDCDTAVQLQPKQKGEY